MLDFCLDKSISSSPSLNSTRKDLYWVEFADNNRLKYELKAKDNRHFRRPKQMTLSITIVVIWAVWAAVLQSCFEETGLHVSLRFLFVKYEQPLTQKNSWFFNMTANMADFTTNFNGNFWHFLFTKSSFCLGKTYAKIIKSKMGLRP